MKKGFCAALMALALCVGLMPAASAAGATTVVLKLGCNRMAVGTAVGPVDEGNAAVAPFGENGRTLVPVSRIVEAFGGSSSWKSGTNDTSYTLNGKTVYHTVGTNIVTTPSGKKTMEVKSRSANNRTYVPVRYVLEGLGLNVEYEPTQQLVVVSTGTLDKNNLLALPGAKALLDSLTQSSAPGSKYTAGKQIAPARNRADMEPKYNSTGLSGTSVPDLAAASGYLLTADGDLNRREGNSVKYQSDWEADRTEVRKAVKEYCDLLSSLPYLKVVQPMTTEWGYTSMAWSYTGTGSVIKGKGRSFAGELPCDVYFYMEEGGWEVRFWFADGLQVVDTGDRLTGGTAAFTGKVYGDRACDAYYCDKGVYYNSSDKKLSTTSGKAALLVNGAPYTGTVDFHTEYSDKAWAVDKFTISGFRRSDWVEFAFPMNRALSGDVFTTEKFQRYDDYPYSTTNRADTWAFAVSSANGSDFVMPMANGDNRYEGVTVRVLQWNKTGDTVVYFCGKLLLDNQSYQLEGLLAAPNRVAGKEQSPSSGSGDKDCWYCGGSGTCPTCRGSGKVKNWMPGTAHTFLEQNCTDCYSPGKCRICGGTGKK